VLRGRGIGLFGVVEQVEIERRHVHRVAGVEGHGVAQSGDLDDRPGPKLSVSPLHPLRIDVLGLVRVDRTLQDRPRGERATDGLIARRPLQLQQVAGRERRGRDERVPDRPE
jgi:hypothetical protein